MEKTIKGTFTVFIKDQKDKYINATLYIDNNIVVVTTNGTTVVYPLQNITKIVITSMEENEKLS